MSPILVALSLFAVAFAADTCNNPAYTDLNRIYPKMLVIPEAPIAHDPFPICTHLNGGPSCCSSELVGNISVAWTVLKNQLDWMCAQQQYYFQQSIAFFPVEYRAKATDIFNQYMIAFNRTVPAFLKKIAGEVCWICDPKWATYYADGKWLITESTCDRFWDDFRGLVDVMRRVAKELGPLMPTPPQDPCADESLCKRLVCDTLIQQYTLKTNDVGAFFQKLLTPGATNGVAVKYVATGGYDAYTIGSNSGLSSAASPRLVLSMAAIGAIVAALVF